MIAGSTDERERVAPPAVEHARVVPQVDMLPRPHHQHGASASSGPRAGANVQGRGAVSAHGTRFQAVKFDRQDPAHRSRRQQDGVTSTYRVSFAGAPSEVSVYSAGTPGEPPALAPVRDWVRAVQEAHGPERAAAKPVADADHAATERALLSAS